MGRYWEWWRTWVRFSCLAPHRQLFLYSLLLYSMVNSFFCFIISFFPFSLLFDYIYGTFAMETFPLCLLFRIRRHHLRHRCDKKKTTTRIWYKTIFVKKGDQLTPGIYTKSVFVCLFAPVSDDDFAFSFHPRRRIKSVFYCYSLFIYYFLLSAKSWVDSNFYPGLFASICLGSF